MTHHDSSSRHNPMLRSKHSKDQRSHRHSMARPVRQNDFDSLICNNHRCQRKRQNEAVKMCSKSMGSGKEHSMVQGLQCSQLRCSIFKHRKHNGSTHNRTHNTGQTSCTAFLSRKRRSLPSHPMTHNTASVQIPRRKRFLPNLASHNLPNTILQDSLVPLAHQRRIWLHKHYHHNISSPTLIHNPHLQTRPPISAT